MPRSTVRAASELDAFLCAPMGEDQNGAPLSVLSALARLNVDPREEAAALAQLPLDAATRKLTSLIAALPVGSSARADPATMAHLLVPLLRSQPARQIRSRAALSRGASIRFQAHRSRNVLPDRDGTHDHEPLDQGSPPHTSVAGKKSCASRRNCLPADYAAAL
jgi:hypothetical protein